MLHTLLRFPSKPSIGQAPRQWPRLALLTVAVLLGHGAVLMAAPLSLGVPTEPRSTAPLQFTFRTVAQTQPGALADAPPPEGKPAAAGKPASAPARATAVPGLAQKKKVFSTETPVNRAQAAPELIAKESPLGEPMALAALTPPAARVETAAAVAPQAPANLAVHPYAIPGAARLSYDVKLEIKGIPLSASGELLWQHDGKTYDARLEYRHVLLGSRVQTSTGQLTPLGLEPIRFGDKVRSEVAAHFERSKNKVTFSANTPDVPLGPGAQDQLSVFMQLAAMLGGEPSRFTAGMDIPFQAVGPRSSETWIFKVGAVELLTLPGGAIKALKLTRDATGEHDSKGEVWFAPELGYLPVRIRLSQANGDFVEQQWRATQKP